MNGLFPAAIVALAMVLAFALPDAVPCLGQCTTNSDCDQTSLCQWCLAGKCGVGCGQKCSTAANCLDSNCNGCVNGTCQHQGAHNLTCGDMCTADEQCEQSFCHLCIQGKCGAGCGNVCTKDLQCGDPNCDGCVNGTCGHRDPHNVPCGGDCSYDGNCELTGCRLCIHGKCGAGCGDPCKESAQCGDSNCFACVNATCQHADPHNVTCGGACIYDGDCQATGPCGLCLNKTCGSGCGNDCTSSSQCLDPNCESCVSGKCTHQDPHNVPCGGDCHNDGECAMPCGLCIAGKCGAGCSMNCTSDAQCGDSNCKHCVDSRCHA